MKNIRKYVTTGIVCGLVGLLGGYILGFRKGFDTGKPKEVFVYSNYTPKYENIYVKIWGKKPIHYKFVCEKNTKEDIWYIPVPYQRAFRGDIDLVFEREKWKDYLKMKRLAQTSVEDFNP